MRIDIYLFQNGYCESREKAKYLIEKGYVTADGRTVKKPSESADGKTVCVTGKMEYVSRGGFKLASALDYFRISVENCLCADIGASTGGFTDCLLQRGAKKVFCIDSGSGQLHPSLAHDIRVVNFENYNAKELNKGLTGGKVDVAVMDVSFISQTLLYDGVSDILSDEGVFISLIKPQFENSRDALSKSGVVKNRKYHIRALDKIILSSREKGLYCYGIIPSPIKGGDGNTEYLAVFYKSETESNIDVEKTVSEALN